MTDLVLGGEALLCSDDFFAEMTHLTRPELARWDEHAFTERGKWMDGWESRRKRTPGNDWCILRLGTPGTPTQVDIDTAHFTGNQPPFGALDGCVAEGMTPEQLRDEATWTQLLEPVVLLPGSHNVYDLADSPHITHVRLRIFPAGGVARLRLLDDTEPPADARVSVPAGGNLLAQAGGAKALACSDQYFAHMDQILDPEPPANMGSGWETRRKRDGGDRDWLVLKMAEAGTLECIEVDTAFFKGNFPDRFALHGLCWPNAEAPRLAGSDHWVEVLPPTRLSADAVHRFDALAAAGPFTHLKLTIFPDGGVSRLRAFGQPAALGGVTGDALVDYLNGLGDAEAIDAFTRCCGARRFAEAMTGQRPFASRAALFGEAEAQWWRLSPADWLEAFTHHPKIGGDVEALRAKFGATAAWSEGEQAGATGADEATLEALAHGNTAYLERFGFIFIVCASGKSAAEMLALLDDRLPNDPAQEIFTAAGEQAKITALRLEKLR
jgi:allantoicase